MIIFWYISNALLPSNTLHSFAYNAFSHPLKRNALSIVYADVIVCNCTNLYNAYLLGLCVHMLIRSYFVTAYYIPLSVKHFKHLRPVSSHDILAVMLGIISAIPYI